MPTFHVMNGDAIEGPYSAGQLRVLEDRGAINGQTPIARSGEAEWLPLEAWREVIHGAPTHRGPVPNIKRKRPKSKEDSVPGLVKVALILALAGMGLVAGGISAEAVRLWEIGAGLFGLAVVLWIVGALRGS